MSQDTGQRTIPLYQEEVTVTKTEVVTDGLRVSTKVEEVPVAIEDVIERGALAVERVAVDFQVQAAPPPRQDGATLIVSIVEERLVVEKRLFVIEELRITRTSTTEHVSITDTVRRTRATVQHSEQAPSTGREIDG